MMKGACVSPAGPFLFWLGFGLIAYEKENAGVGSAPLFFEAMPFIHKTTV